MDQQDSPIPITSSSNGRVSGKPWKHKKTAIRSVLYPSYPYLCLSPLDLRVSRSHMQPALKPTSFDDRMEKTTKAQAIKKLQVELKEEKQAEIQR